MPTEIRVWEIRKDGLVEVQERPFSESHRECELEDWIAQKPSLLGEDLLNATSYVIAHKRRNVLLGLIQLANSVSTARMTSSNWGK